MRRGVKNLVALLVLLGMAWCAAPLSAEPGDDADLVEVRRRLSELAGSYPEQSAQAEAASESPAPSPAPASAADLAAEAEAIENTPLGLGSGREPGETPSVGGGNWVLSTFAALGTVIGLILAARWAYAKLGGKVVARPSQSIEVLSRTAVAPKNHVLLLRVGQRVLVVGDSSTGLRTLANLDDPEEVASLIQSVEASRPTSVSQSFNGLLSRFNGQYDADAQADHEGLDESEARIDHARDALAGLASRIRALGGKGGA